MKRIFFLILCALFLTGCHGVPEETEAFSIPEATAATTAHPHTEPEIETETLAPDPVEEILQSMPLEDWVGQLFLVGADPNLAQIHILDYNLGGFLLFSEDFANETPGDSAAKKIARWQETADIPMLIAVDEEGGIVTRISRYSYYRDKRFASARSLYDQGGIDAVLAEEDEKCQLLKSLGVNVNLGPVCDITTDPSAFMYPRSLGQPPQVTAEYIRSAVELKRQHSVGSALKHFPGYGNNVDTHTGIDIDSRCRYGYPRCFHSRGNNVDTHTGIAIDSRSLSELESRDLIPFQAGIDAGAEAVMVSHTIVEAIDPTLPASLSPAVVRYLRETMGFEGVILTDDLTMQAITDQYGAGEAAVMAVQAGCDLLCSSAFIEQYEAVLDAVLDGRIDFDTLKNAVRNVLEWKMELGLI